MNKTEVAKLLTIASMIDNRTVAPETVEAWHMTLGRHDFNICKEAMALHFRESEEYLMPVHITKNLPRVRMKINQDVRAAIARGIVGRDWPDDQMLTPDAAEELQQARAKDGQSAARYPSRSDVSDWALKPFKDDLSVRSIEEVP